MACLAEKSLEPLGLGRTARLSGLLHDLGKGTPGFRDYLIWCHGHPGEKRAGPAHAPAGAMYAHERWFHGDSWQRLTAQVVSMAVYGHHAGLPDCLNAEGGSPYLGALGEDVKRDIGYREAREYFLSEVAGPEELDALFESARGEVRAFLDRGNRRGQHFTGGMLSRLILSAVVDADRWDSAAFERGEAPVFPEEDPPDWSALLGALEVWMVERFTKKSHVNDVRAQILKAFAGGAAHPRGIFTATVPTGGGKTLASLRFALAHAAKESSAGNPGQIGLRRVFYIIPYNTILDQNAAVIREALGGYDILEHHSGVTQESEEEYAAHRRLTERWEDGVVLTSMVQYLNALFRKENTDARRMRALAGSVLIFDEVQALPRNCTRLFEESLKFLVENCGCTALILTATQPSLNLERRELIPNVPALFGALRRVSYADESHVPRGNERAAADLAALYLEHRAVLAVVNTKRVARDIFRRARDLVGADAWCAHLSTEMCPAHRLEVRAEIRARLDAKKPELLISTQLIEAGVDLSFPVVVRSLASMPSVIQAGGRCNRNGEKSLGTVYIWKLQEESLDRLTEIRKGQEISDEILRYLETNPGEPGDPAVIARYFDKERKVFEADLSYPYKEDRWESNLLDMLSGNEKCALAAKDRKEDPLPRLVLRQRFRASGEHFKVIDAPTRSVLTPWGAGEEITLALATAPSMKDEIALLRRAQRYSVNLYEHAFRALEARGALYSLGETGAIALRKEFYDGATGVRLESGEMDFLGY